MAWRRFHFFWKIGTQDCSGASVGCTSSSNIPDPGQCLGLDSDPPAAREPAGAGGRMAVPAALQSGSMSHLALLVGECHGVRPRSAAER